VDQCFIDQMHITCSNRSQCPPPMEEDMDSLPLNTH
ncbi:hypothetical protein KIPB_015710, partial [Kipferlia bialata]